MSQPNNTIGKEKMETIKRITVPLVYCDYIALVIKEAITQEATTPDSLLAGCGRVRFDLGEDGSFASTTKFINCADVNGRLYEITVKEVTK
jgi:hypothetical protein